MRPNPQAMLVATVVALALAPSAHAAAMKAAVFNFELVDTSTEGELDGVRKDQTRRLEHATEQVKEAFKAKGLEIVDVAPAKDQLKDVKELHECLQCAQKAAKAVGADIAVVGHVQKVSNLILNINLQIVDADSGKTIRGGSADIRGNTDESWDRGAKYLLKNNILKEPLEAAGR